MSRDRAGAALVLTLLIMLALQLLAHGALLMARQQAAASAADVRLLRARAGARAAVSSAREAPAPASLDPVAVGAALTGPGPSFQGVQARWRLRRAAREWWLAEGWGHVGALAWETREARLLWRLDPGARVAAFTAGAEVGDGARSEVRGAILPVPAREGCADAGGAALLDTLLPAGLPAMGAASDGRVARGALGPVGWEEGVGALPVHVDGSGAPIPVDSAGTCLEGAWNWGDPSRPGAPCAGRRVWRAAPGDLVVMGGSGEGVLLVRGNVELTGTLFVGVILARGDVLLREGAEVRGLVLAGGALVLDAPSRITGSACAALAALAAAPPSLASLRAAPEVGWLPVF